MESDSPYRAPTQAAPSTSPLIGTRSVCIKSIDILSAGKMLGVFYAFIGLIIGGFLSLFAILGIAAGGGGGDVVVGGLITGVGALIIVPVIYGVLGFIGGIIGSLLYNVVAGMMGGIRFDLEG